MQKRRSHILKRELHASRFRMCFIATNGAISRATANAGVVSDITTNGTKGSLRRQLRWFGSYGIVVGSIYNAAIVGDSVVE